MNSIFDAGDEPLTEEDLAAVKETPRSAWACGDEGSAISGTAFLLSCAAVTPFLAEHSLHPSWGPVPQVILLSLLASLLMLRILWSATVESVERICVI